MTKPGTTVVRTGDTEINNYPVVVSKSLPESKAPTAVETIDGMVIFRKDIDKQTVHRFDDVAERIQGPLIEYLRKNTKNFRPMALRLMILGKDEATAKPWIVVLCPAHTSKKVKQFFQKDRIKRLYLSNEPSEISFEVTTSSPPLKLSALDQLIGVFGITDFYKENGNWSTPIRLHQKAGQRYATMGGLIVATGPNNVKTYYGLTAGHILEHEDMLPETDDDEDSGYTSQDNHDSSSDGDTIVEDPLAEILAETTEPSISYAIIHYEGWKRVGQISDASFSSQAINRDWALVEGVEELLKQPGHLKIEEMDTDSDISTTDSPADTTLDVVLMEVGTPQKSWVSRLPAMVLLPSASKFVRTFILTPSKGFGACLSSPESPSC